MAEADPLLVIVALQQRLELLSATIDKLKQLRLVAANDADKRAVNGRLAELNMAFAHAKAQYEVAKMGASQIQPPSDEVSKKIKALADRVQIFVANDKAVHAGIQIAGEVFELMKELAA